MTVAERIKAWWDNMTQHVDPEASFKTMVTESLTHLENEYAKYAGTADAAYAKLAARVAALEPKVEAPAAALAAPSASAPAAPAVESNREAADPAPHVEEAKGEEHEGKQG